MKLMRFRTAEAKPTMFQPLPTSASETRSRAFIVGFIPTFSNASETCGRDSGNAVLPDAG
jgi:hypothetical protein